MMKAIIVLEVTEEEDRYEVRMDWNVDPGIPSIVILDNLAMFEEALIREAHEQAAAHERRN